MSLSHDHTTIHQAYHYYSMMYIRAKITCTSILFATYGTIWRLWSLNWYGVKGLLWAYYYITLTYVMCFNKLREKSSEPRYSAYFYGRSRQEYLGIENDRWLLPVEHDIWNLSGYISGLDNNDFLCFVGHLFWYDICFTSLICLDEFFCLNSTMRMIICMQL